MVEAVSARRMWVSDINNRKARESPTTVKQSKPKLQAINKARLASLSEQPLFATHPEAVLPLLSMIGQAQLSIDDLLGTISRQSASMC